MDPKLRKLLGWIGKNAWRESRALYPNPVRHVAFNALVDQIRDVFGDTEKEIDDALMGDSVSVSAAYEKLCEIEKKFLYACGWEGGIWCTPGDVDEVTREIKRPLTSWDRSCYCEKCNRLTQAMHRGCYGLRMK